MQQQIESEWKKVQPQDYKYFVPHKTTDPIRIYKLNPGDLFFSTKKLSQDYLKLVKTYKRVKWYNPISWFTKYYIYEFIGVLNENNRNYR